MRMVILRHVLVLVVSLVTNFYLTPLLIKAAQRLRFLDNPDGSLKVHKEPIPFLGGIGIFCSFITSLALLLPFENLMMWLMCGTTILLFIGFIDDLRALKPGQKFIGQALAVLCFLKGGFTLKWFFLSSSVLNMALSAFWMLSIINAFNLVDVMDGLCGILALVAGATFLILALWFQAYSVSLVIVAFLGSLAGFLWYNRPPAKIYLGDGGSLFIGGLLAALPFLFPWSSQFDAAYYAPTIILGVPSLEVISLIVIRQWLGIPFFQGSPHHFSCYLQNKGWSKRSILVFAASMSSVASAIALLYVLQIFSFVMLLIMGFAYLVIWFLFIFSALFKTNKEASSASVGRLSTKVV